MSYLTALLDELPSVLRLRNLGDPGPLERWRGEVIAALAPDEPIVCKDCRCTLDASDLKARSFGICDVCADAYDDEGPQQEGQDGH